MIIGISGKKQHGKDTVAKIIQYLTYANIREMDGNTLEWKVADFLKDHNNATVLSKWQTRQFAGKLKQIVCLLIGCTLEQLEDNDFKEKPLGEEWFFWEGKGFRDERYIYASLDDAYAAKKKEQIYNYSGPYSHTPRTLLQLIGTDCGRNILHPNIWINALFADYKPSKPHRGGGKMTLQTSAGTYYPQAEREGYKYPNWIITDVRFPNEIESIVEKGGIVIRVVNPRKTSTDTHYSETALDNYHDFQKVIINDGTIEDLVVKVRELLIYYKILKPTENGKNITSTGS